MKKYILIIILVLIFVIDSQAQCAMCKSVVESNMENGDTIGGGLNDGILYLMAMPYISSGLGTIESKIIVLSENNYL